MKKDYELKENENGYVIMYIRDAYKYYRRSVQDPFSQTLYSQILAFIFTRAWYYMITQNWIFKWPYKMGYFYISETKSEKGLYRNWRKSANKGKIVREYNMHTDGRIFKIYWDKRFKRNKASILYRFDPIRGTKESLTGRRGVAGWVQKCAADPLMKDFRGTLV